MIYQIKGMYEMFFAGGQIHFGLWYIMAETSRGTRTYLKWW